MKHASSFNPGLNDALDFNPDENHAFHFKPDENHAFCFNPSEDLFSISILVITILSVSTLVRTMLSLLVLVRNAFHFDFDPCKNHAFDFNQYLLHAFRYSPDHASFSILVIEKHVSESQNASLVRWRLRARYSGQPASHRAGVTRAVGVIQGREACFVLSMYGQRDRDQEGREEPIARGGCRAK